jgi:hypothetical protein
MQGHSVTCHIYGFLPYFYVSAPRNFNPADCDVFRACLNSKLAVCKPGLQALVLKLAAQRARYWMQAVFPARQSEQAYLIRTANAYPHTLPRLSHRSRRASATSRPPVGSSCWPWKSSARSLCTATNHRYPIFCRLANRVFFLVIGRSAWPFFPCGYILLRDGSHSNRVTVTPDPAMPTNSRALFPMSLISK